LRKWLRCAASVICCALFASCAAAPAPPPQQAYLGPFHPIPNYPDEYQDSPRAGEAYVKCAELPDLRVSNCSVLATSGGDAFGRSVVELVTQPDYRVPPPPTGQHRGFHYVFMTFGKPGDDDPKALDISVSGAPATLPPGYRPAWATAPSSAENVVADCSIAADGTPHDCRVIRDDLTDDLGGAAEAWLAAPGVKYPPPSRSVGERRLVFVHFVRPS
jgi:hypothetical protein